MIQDRALTRDVFARTWDCVREYFVPEFFAIVVITSCTFRGSHGLEVFASSSPMRKLVIDENDNILIGGDNVILQFKNMSLAEENLVHRLNTSYMEPLSAEPFDSDNVPSIFQTVWLAGLGADYLLFCTSAQNMSCSLHSTSNISQYWPVRGSEDVLDLGRASTAVVVSTQDSGKRLIFMAATFGDENEDWTGYVFSKQRLVYSIIPKFGYAMMRYEKLSVAYLESIPTARFSFIFGFSAPEADGVFYHMHSYVLRNTVEPDGKLGFISQICNDTFFRSYIEARIECSGYTELVAATEKTTQNGQVLLATFRKPDRPETGALCMYRVSSINTFFHEQNRKCFKGESGSAPDWTANTNESCTADVVSILSAKRKNVVLR